jgi:hypothetical protein
VAFAAAVTDPINSSTRRRTSLQQKASWLPFERSISKKPDRASLESRLLHSWAANSAMYLMSCNVHIVYFKPAHDCTISFLAPSMAWRRECGGIVSRVSSRNLTHLSSGPSA